MASEVEIINEALIRLGASKITSRTEDSDAAIAADSVFDGRRDDLLRGHTWNFATRRTQLARSAVVPTSEFDYQFPVPTDFLRVAVVSDSDVGKTTVAYRIGSHSTDGTVILTDATQLFLTYVAQITDPNEMPPDFRRALSSALAVDLAVTLTNSATLMERMQVQAAADLRRAKSTESIEDFPEQRPLGSWASSRNGDGVYWPR